VKQIATCAIYYSKNLRSTTITRSSFKSIEMTCSFRSITIGRDLQFLKRQGTVAAAAVEAPLQHAQMHFAVCKLEKTQVQMPLGAQKTLNLTLAVILHLPETKIQNPTPFFPNYTQPCHRSYATLFPYWLRMDHYTMEKFLFPLAAAVAATLPMITNNSTELIAL